MPNGPLPHRRNIVITDVPGETFEGCETVNSIEEVIELVKNEQLAFVIGGGMIYRQFFPIAGKLFLTLVHKDFEADIFFPEIKFEEWIVDDREDLYDGINDFHYSNLDLIRK